MIGATPECLVNIKSTHKSRWLQLMHIVLLQSIHKESVTEYGI